MWNRNFVKIFYLSTTVQSDLSLNLSWMYALIHTKVLKLIMVPPKGTGPVAALKTTPPPLRSNWSLFSKSVHQRGFFMEFLQIWNPESGVLWRYARSALPNLPLQNPYETLKIPQNFLALRAKLEGGFWVICGAQNSSRTSERGGFMVEGFFMVFKSPVIGVFREPNLAGIRGSLTTLDGFRNSNFQVNH